MDTRGLRLFAAGIAGSDPAAENAMRAEHYHAQAAALGYSREQAETTLGDVMREGRESAARIDDPWGIAFRRLLDPDPPPPACRDAAKQICALNGYPAHPENVDAIANTLRRIAG